MEFVLVRLGGPALSAGWDYQPVSKTGGPPVGSQPIETYGQLPNPAEKCTSHIKCLPLWKGHLSGWDLFL